MAHQLIVEEGAKKTTCECGETFAASPAGFKKWQTHVSSFKVLNDLYIAIAQENEARAAAEKLMVKAAAAGMSTSAISKACGLKGDGKPLISPTSVQRVIRTHNTPEAKTANVQTPRRRRRDG